MYDWPNLKNVTCRHFNHSDNMESLPLQSLRKTTPFDKPRSPTHYINTRYDSSFKHKCHQQHINKWNCWPTSLSSQFQRIYKQIATKVDIIRIHHPQSWLHFSNPWWFQETSKELKIKLWNPTSFLPHVSMKYLDVLFTYPPMNRQRMQWVCSE